MPRATHLYSTSVKLGDQTFELLVDTGSADTWVKTTSPPSSFHEIPDTFFSLNYGGQSVAEATGTWGKIDVTIGGIAVHDQVMGIANHSISADGILGLAYPGFVSMRSAINGRFIDYDPIFTRMIKDEYISAGILSLALEADSTGKMGFGGVPSGIKHEDNWFHTPLLSGKERASRPGMSPWYNISLSYSFPGAENVEGSRGQPSNTFFTIVDSGAPWETIPLSVLKALGAAFKPQATIVDTARAGNMVLGFDCDATVPEFGYVIGGQTFKWKKEDWTTEANGVCTSRIVGSSLEWPNPVGIVAGGGFLQKVLAVFDVENEEIWFSPRS
ncbi:hypothetical protein BLS_002342 [Venturia inaequalis]|nr:hypothetical protein BLS_002342 [Venturia inaequalis]RDI79012.1 hypothetical protein Vi05172_g10898 [Venturia inaequalis]